MANNEMMANIRGGALVGAGFGGIIGAVIGWLMGAHMVAVPVVGPVVGQGVLSTALVAAVAGVAAGALLGGLIGVFSPIPDLETPEDTVVVTQTVPADTIVGGGPALAQVPAPLLNASPVPEAELEAQQLLYPTSGMGIATPDAGVNPFAVTLEHEAILTRPVKVTAPLVPPTEEQLAPLPAVPVKVTAPLVQQEEPAPAVDTQADTPPQGETLPISGSWVTFDPGASPQERIDTATIDTQVDVEPDGDTASTSTPLMRVKRRRRIMPAGDEERPGE